MNRLMMAGGLVLAFAVFSASTTWAAEGSRPYYVENRLAIGYDDNPRGLGGSDSRGATSVSDLLSFGLENNRANGFLTMNGGVGLTWWDKLDTTDWTYRADLDANQKLSQRLELMLAEHFSQIDRPQLTADDGTIRRPEYKYRYNSLNLGAMAFLTPSMRLSPEVRWQMMRYDYSDEDVNSSEDYDSYAVGATLISALNATTVGLAELRYEQLTYANAGKPYEGSRQITGMNTNAFTQIIPDRSSDSIVAALGAEHVFNQNLMGKLVGGGWYRSYEAEADDDVSPYVEGSFTVMPSSSTRITAAGAYVSYKSSLTAFLSQQRTSLSLAVAHDVTARITLSLTGIYFDSQYDSQFSAVTSSSGKIEQDVVTSGSEQSWSVDLRASYRINTRNWVDVEFTTYSIQSDYANRSYDRNWAGVAWRTRL